MYEYVSTHGWEVGYKASWGYSWSKAHAIHVYSLPCQEPLVHENVFVSRQWYTVVWQKENSPSKETTKSSSITLVGRLNPLLLITSKRCCVCFWLWGRPVLSNEKVRLLSWRGMLDWMPWGRVGCYSQVSRMVRAAAACTGWLSAVEPLWRTSCGLCCCHNHISDKERSETRVELSDGSNLHHPIFDSASAETEVSFQRVVFKLFELLRLEIIKHLLKRGVPKNTFN